MTIKVSRLTVNLLSVGSNPSLVMIFCTHRIRVFVNLFLTIGIGQVGTSIFNCVEILGDYPVLRYNCK